MASLKTGNSSFLPRLWLLCLDCMGKIFKGDQKSSCYTGLSPSMQQGSAGVTLVYMGIAGRRLGGLVFQENYEMQQSNLGLLRVRLLLQESSPCQPWWSLVGRADMFDAGWGPRSPQRLQLVNAMKLGCRRWEGRLPWGLNVAVTTREESMAAGSLWFLGGYLFYWERRKNNSISGPWNSAVKPDIQHPSRDFHAIIFIG